MKKGEKRIEIYCDDIDDLCIQIEEFLQKMNEEINFMEQNVWNGSIRSHQQYDSLRNVVESSRHVISKLNSTVTTVRESTGSINKNS